MSEFGRQKNRMISLGQRVEWVPEKSGNTLRFKKVLVGTTAHKKVEHFSLWHAPRKVKAPATAKAARMESPIQFSVLQFLPGRRFGTMLAGALVVILTSTPLMLAFEAHVINVTATIIQLNPPVINPPVLQCRDATLVTITDSDPDVTDIFYTVTPGTDANLAPDPVCGGPSGGGNPVTPFGITDDSVVKAIACDGAGVNAHHSQVVTQIYDLSCFGKIEGHKYKDANKNEAFDPQVDFGVEGWRMDLLVATSSGTTTVQTTITDPTGYYTFNNLAPGYYEVKEEDRTDWSHVSPNQQGTTIVGNETKVLDFLNSENNNQCLPQDLIFPSSLAVQAAGGTSGNDDIAVASNVTIQGSVRTNDELERIGSAAVSRTITGNAVVHNTIDTGFLISGGVVGAAPAVSLTAVDQTTWKANAALGGTVNGSFTFPDNLVGLSLGPTEILGNVTFGQNNIAAIKGPMYIHGNLTIGTSTTLTQDAGLADAFLTIIVDGTITVNPGVSFVKAGTRGAFLLISNSAAIPGDAAAINVYAHNSNVGDAVLYALSGDIHIGAGRSVLAAFAQSGTGLDSDPNTAVRIDTGATVAFRDLPTQISCGPRQPFDQTGHVVINEFMPNPAGGVVGVLGGPLDGQWVEIFNPTASQINVAGYFLYDNDNTHALPITTLNSSTGSTLIPSKGRIVIYREGDADFNLETAAGDSVRLFSGDIGLGGTLVDSHTYTADSPVNKSFARIPDGTANWIDPDSTPGDPNYFFFEPLDSLPDGSPVVTLPTLPQIEIGGGYAKEIPVSTAPDNDSPPVPLPTPLEVIKGLVAGASTTAQDILNSISDLASTTPGTTTTDLASSTIEIINNVNPVTGSAGGGGGSAAPSVANDVQNNVDTGGNTNDPGPTTTTPADVMTTPAITQESQSVQDIQQVAGTESTTDAPAPDTSVAPPTPPADPTPPPPPADPAPLPVDNSAQ